MECCRKCFNTFMTTLNVLHLSAHWSPFVQTDPQICDENQQRILFAVPRRGAVTKLSNLRTALVEGQRRTITASAASPFTFPRQLTGGEAASTSCPERMP